MKSFPLRPALLLALALSLSACGGKAEFDVKGTVEGLQYDGLVLKNGTSTLAVNANKPATSETTFRFPNTIEYGDTYNVEIDLSAPNFGQPAHQTCQLFNGEDTAGRLASINVGISCSLNQVPITGKVTGLTVDGLELINGSTNFLPLGKLNNDLVYTLGAVAYGTTYGVSIFKQPVGLTCRLKDNNGAITSGVGTAGDLPIVIHVDCT